jgi:hypothetical protein
MVLVLVPLPAMDAGEATAAMLFATGVWVIVAEAVLPPLASVDLMTQLPPTVDAV